MRKASINIKGLTLILLALPAIASAQMGTSVNTFSPYTFYGIGDINTPGFADARSMGGAGLGLRNSLRINPLNPAALSAVGRKSFLFNMGVESQNFYLRSGDKRSVNNSINFRELAVQLPLTNGIGIGMNVTPLSSVGYDTYMHETDPGILGNIGDVIYHYKGSGGITQGKISLGAQPFNRLSIGADLIYYHGRINREFSNDIVPASTSIEYANTLGSAISTFSKVWFDMGMQYNIIQSTKRILTLGATYQPRVNLKPEVTRIITSSYAISENVEQTRKVENLYMPDMLKAGLFYQTSKLGAGIDLGYKNWGKMGNNSNYTNVQYRNTRSINAGIQYTPNAMDIRRWSNRLTYRLGVRYEDYYLKINGYKIDDAAITAGVGIPLTPGGLNSMNVGVEVGRRGVDASGYYNTQSFTMHKETYFKVSVGLSLFGEDYWFVRYKFD